ncbi:uncharacterized protein LOC114928136 [Nylanderia fulva]|uniref:uncharacterized protein LOC114928136 n=1 Tax=Nylanderia fulva TaxID=613905 RepID=UPI0010FAD5C3|nr:uncharacterized protein LOC114928136 [Nylanderia fulva]
MSEAASFDAASDVDGSLTLSVLRLIIKTVDGLSNAASVNLLSSKSSPYRAPAGTVSERKEVSVKRAPSQTKPTPFAPVLLATAWGLALADPDPSSKKSINVLIGADLYDQLLIGPIKKRPLGSPTAQLTTLGWIISGPTDDPREPRAERTSAIHYAIAQNTDALIRKFWEIEEVPTQRFLTQDEEECERHFVETHTRDTTGRYIVRLPLRHRSPLEIGDSHQIALSWYAQQEQRLKENRNSRAPIPSF